MTSTQTRVLDDMVAYVQWAQEHNVPFMSILATLGHDINGILRQEECFLPRTYRYATMRRHKQAST